MMLVAVSLFMRIKRTLPILFAVVAIAAAVFLLVQLRKHAPPEPARLLPAADGFLYVNLKWIRTFSATSPVPSVSHDPDYERFLQETGFEFERDLDQAALAVHYPAAWNGGTGGSAPEPRFSEVFVGKIDSDRLTAYLKKLAASTESYRNTEIYSIPLEGRTVRVAILSVDTVAASNHEDPNLIRGIIDRSRKLASPFAGPIFLRQYYKKLPLASLAWAIVRTEPTAKNSVFSSASLILQKPTVVAISARYLTALHLRVEAFTATENDARALTERAGAFLNVFHAATGDVQAGGTENLPSDDDMKRFFDSARVEQHDDRVVLTATLPTGFLKKLLEAPPAEATQPAPEPPAPAKRR